MNLPRYHNMEPMFLTHLIACYEIRKASRSMNRLIYHLGRCKKQKDRSKLLMMIICYIILIVQLIVIMIKGMTDMVDILIPPLPRKPQLLIENL